MEAAERARKRRRQLKWLQYSGIGTVWGLFVAACVAAAWVGDVPWVVAGVLSVGATVLLAWVSDAVMLELDPVKVPVLMYHSVAPEFDLIPAAGLSVRPEVFAAQLRILQEEGFTTHTLSELRAHLTEEIRLTGKPVVITFDDGYLDNYVFAFPILERLGMKATIFVSEDFIDHATAPRSRVREGDGDDDGGLYLSWLEIREMMDSGLVEVESHGMSHDLLPSSDRIVDFFRPGVRDPWLAWRVHPRDKARWFRRREEELGYGRPLYESGPALEAPRFVPDETLATGLMEHVRRNGGGAFFQRDGWRDDLDQVVEGYRAAHDGRTGRLESTGEWRSRVLEELVGSRVRLSRNLGREVRFLAWPHDTHNVHLESIAIEEAGYLATTAGTHQNEPGADPRGISRIPAGEALLGRRWRRADLWLFRANLLLFRGNYFYYVPAFVANRIRSVVQRVAPGH